MEIKGYIKERRLELGLTLEQVGRYVGVGKATVKRWENGLISNLGCDKIAKLAEILKISPLCIVYDNVETINSIKGCLISNAELLNAEGLKILVEYSDNLVSSGKYETGKSSYFSSKW